MYLAYFDENKHTKENPTFFIGGIIIPDSKAIEFESTLSQIQYNCFGTNVLTKETELHGKEIFHGKGVFKNKKMTERIQIFDNITTFILSNNIPIRMVNIDVEKHKSKYAYPEPEYQLGLMLILERFCGFLDGVDDIGIVFGDYEKDEITKSVLDFSQFKISGKTPMAFGRPLGRLIDTIYFTHSHHSRFLQLADILIFMAGRFENKNNFTKWHDKKVKGFWEKIKANANITIKRWP